MATLTYAIIQHATSAGLNTALIASKVANPSSWRVVGVGFDSGDNEYFALVEYNA